MKKVLFISAGVLAALVVVGLVLAFVFLDSIVKKGVETAGPMVTQVDVKLDGVKLSPFSGKGELKGLFVGNPEGFKSESAIRMGTISVALQPGSVLSDKIVVESILIDAPEITFEGSLRGNNLSKILDNVQSFSSGEEKAGTKEKSAASRKIQVNDLRIQGGKINVRVAELGGAGAPVPLPPIHLSNLGQGEEGITAAELIKVVLDAIAKEAIPAATGAIGDIGKTGTEQIQKGGEQLQKATKSIGDLFKKKDE